MTCCGYRKRVGADDNGVVRDLSGGGTKHSSTKAKTVKTMSEAMTPLGEYPRPMKPEL